MSFSRWNFIHSFWSLGLVSFVGLAFNIVLARLLSIEDVGHIRVVRSVIELAYFPAGLGMNIAAGKFAADLRLSPDERRASLRVAFTVALIVSLSLTVALFCLTWWPGMLKDQVARGMLHVMVWVVPVVVLTRVCMGHLQGTNRIRLLAIQQSSRSMVLMTLGAGMVALMGLSGWSAGLWIAEIFAIGLVLKFVGKDLFSGDAAKALVLRPAMLQFGLPIAATQTLQALVVSVDVICLDRFHNNSAVIAQYGMATLILSATMLVPQSLIQTQFSKIAAHGHDAKIHWTHFWRFFLRAMVAIIVGGVMGYFCTPVLGWVFGAEYARSGEILGWLIPAFVAQSAGLLAGTFVVNAGLARHHFATACISAAVNVALCLALIPGWGVVGAVVASTLTFLVRVLLSIIVLWNYRRTYAG